MKVIGIVFSKPKEYPDPLYPMGLKRPVYEELISKCARDGIKVVIVSTKSYKGSGLFDWYWETDSSGKTIFVDKAIKVDLGYDRSGGLSFPVVDDDFKVVDNYDFKQFAWNKWQAYSLLSKYMPETYLYKDRYNVKTDWVVLKPIDGLKGRGIYIGPKNEMDNFELLESRQYIAQEFIDTSKGVSGIASGIHDLRVVVINSKLVWSHIRIPPCGLYKSNVAGGGQLKEVQLDDIPTSVIEIVQKISDMLYNRFDNPIYSVDFGISSNGRPYVFEINDQMGFPKPEMTNKDKFLDELIRNFKLKL